MFFMAVLCFAIFNFIHNKILFFHLFKSFSDIKSLQLYFKIFCNSFSSPLFRLSIWQGYNCCLLLSSHRKFTIFLLTVRNTLFGFGQDWTVINGWQNIPVFRGQLITRTWTIAVAPVCANHHQFVVKKFPRAIKSISGVCENLIRRFETVSLLVFRIRPNRLQRWKSRFNRFEGAYVFCLYTAEINIVPFKLSVGFWKDRYSQILCTYPSKSNYIRIQIFSQRFPFKTKLSRNSITRN